jgi:hypothetical protein
MDWKKVRDGVYKHTNFKLGLRQRDLLRQMTINSWRESKMRSLFICVSRNGDCSLQQNVMDMP